MSAEMTNTPQFDVARHEVPLLHLMVATGLEYLKFFGHLDDPEYSQIKGLLPEPVSRKGSSEEHQVWAAQLLLVQACIKPWVPEGTDVYFAVTYSGSGDSGDYDGHEFFGLDMNSGISFNLPDHFYKHLDVGGTDSFFRYGVEAYMSDSHSGWENGDGASGSLVTHLFSGKIEHQHTGYYTESNERFVEKNLFSLPEQKPDNL